MASTLSLPHLQRRLRQLSLSSSPKSALFYSELYYAIFPPSSSSEPATHDGLHTFALALLANDQPYSALALVRDTADADDMTESEAEDFPHDPKDYPGCSACAVILARCSTKVARFTEGCAFLSRAVHRATTLGQTIDVPTLTPSENTHLLLASLAQQAKQPELAAENYTRAWQDDPWCWEAFLGLCEIGTPPETADLFPSPPASAPSATLPPPPPVPSSRPSPLPRSSVADVIALRKQLSPLAEPSNGFFTPAPAHEAAVPSRLGIMGQGWENTPSFQADTTFPSLADTPGPGQAILPTRRQPLFNPSRANLLDDSQGRPINKRARGEKVLASKAGGATNWKESDMLGPTQTKAVDNSVVRRSSRLSQVGGTASNRTGTARLATSRDKRTARSTRSRSATSSTGSTATKLPAPDRSAAQSPEALERLSQHATDDWLLDLVRTCARAWRALSLYRCREALSEIETLPREVRASGWALAVVARAWYELADYSKARHAYEDLVRVEPYRLDQMEHYSTLLWHLNDAPALSYLSQRLLPIDRETPQPWIAAGNCFSLNSDHDEAMRCFRRAAALRPDCAYAWTLCGYEAIAMEEYERATAFYRTAIRADARHYNAWYGLGLVYMNMAKFRHAHHHFVRALEINPTNAVLLCCLGAVHEKEGDYERALAVYERACAYAPESAMVKFKSVRVRVCLGQFETAARELEELTRKTATEPNVFMLLGKVQHKLGNREAATHAFVVARELDPKLEGPIRIVFEGIDDDEQSSA